MAADAFFNKAGCQNLVVDVGQGSRDLLLLNVQAFVLTYFFFSIYVILKLKESGLQKKREDVMAWLTTGMFQHTSRICLGNAETGHRGFVFLWLHKK